MRRSLFAVSLPFALLFIAGCPEKKPDDTKPSATAESAAPAPTVTATTTSSAKGASGKMVHCPNAVAGAKVDVKDVEGGVEVTITASDDAGTNDIRERSKHLADVAKEQSKDNKTHNGSGSGGGVSGRCPIVLRETTIDVAEVDHGSKLTVKAKDPKEADWLQRETRERQAELEGPNGKGAGERKMANCPSAVPGAATSYKDTPQAVVISVLAKTDDATKEVRERAKHLVEDAKKGIPSADAGDKKHDGMGDGGGTVGRCPVIFADTTLDAKDVAGGTEFTIKPKQASQLAELKKVAKDRVQNFNPSVAGSASATPTAAPPSPHLIRPPG